MAIQLIIDGGCDLSQQQAQSLGIALIPMTVHFGEQEYHPGFDLTHEEFYRLLTESKDIPTTSQPTPYDYEEVYSAVKRNGDQAVVICISSVLSGTYQSACIAAEEFSDCVFVVDSKSVSVGQRLLLHRAMQLRDTGLSAAEIAAILQKEVERIRIYGVVDTLEYLVKGGRLSKAAGFAGSVMGIRPVLRLHEGALEMMGKARGVRAANTMMTAAVLKDGIDPAYPTAVGYTGNDPSVLETYLETSDNLWNTPNALPIGMIGGTIGTHAGPGLIAVAFFAKEEC